MKKIKLVYFPFFIFSLQVSFFSVATERIEIYPVILKANITAASCNLKLDTGSHYQTVTFPDVTIIDLLNNNVEWESFKLRLGGCSRSVEYIHIDVLTDDLIKNSYKFATNINNSGSGIAENVAIQIEYKPENNGNWRSVTNNGSFHIKKDFNKKSATAYLRARPVIYNPDEKLFSGRYETLVHFVFSYD
ncbi:hypothetical protein SKA34_09033 [Photobacterium sp. SKA34]|uniref:fimbrial protein n=1 Tax=Photobacterium sp. SKA34 TaxID=121723 RepID=UPI00006B411F|nr:fimbrial protein [Photobacterium sp. SKA34]EAR57719.1 hypothetical protein SKA34_09033 [Photobacterium sp. SKA34]